MGRAGEIIVSVRWLSSGIRIIVDDDGCGFDVQARFPIGGRRGLGLPGIRERITAMRGSLQIESKLQEGTRVILEVPLTAPVPLSTPALVTV